MSATNTPGCDPPAILDAECVATMHRFDLVRRLYPAFIAELSARLAELRAAVATLDRPVVRRVTHRLRGGAAQIGAAGLSQALSTIEEAASQEGVEALENAMSGLDDLVQATITALLREVAR